MVNNQFAMFEHAHGLIDVLTSGRSEKQKRVGLRLHFMLYMIAREMILLRCYSGLDGQQKKSKRKFLKIE